MPFTSAALTPFGLESLELVQAVHYFRQERRGKTEQTFQHTQLYLASAAHALQPCSAFLCVLTQIIPQWCSQGSEAAAGLVPCPLALTSPGPSPGLRRGPSLSCPFLLLPLSPVALKKQFPPREARLSWRFVSSLTHERH